MESIPQNLEDSSSIHVLVGKKELAQTTSLRSDVIPLPPIAGLVINEDTLVLLKTHLFVNIEHSLAEITFRTDYMNSSSNPIELIYQFPVDPQFAVHWVKAKVDEKEIITQIKEKEESK
jgi:hypothetical protein